MSVLDPRIAQMLDRQVPLRLERRPAWDDILARAGVSRATGWPAPFAPSRRLRRRLVVALAIVVAALVVGSAVAAALGHNPFGGLSSWLAGSPGSPAPTAEQAGFSARNDAVYASFPKGTELRLLVRESVRGKTFSLFGFRNSSSLCLRLARADNPTGQGVNECVDLRELRRSSAPVLVASTAYFGLAHGRLVDGIFGFADDAVRAVRLRRSLGGRQIAVVRSNAFLALRVRRREAVYDPIVRVRALTRGGRTVPVQFSPPGGAPVLPGTPSYYRQERVSFLGPKRPEARLPGRAIGWLDKREPRGEPFTPNLRTFGPGGATVVFSRSIQPDSGSPFRIGLSLIRVTPRAHGFVPGPVWGRIIPLRAGRLLLCITELYPLRPKPFGYLCTPQAASASLLAARRPLSVRSMFREVFTRVFGIAADGVKEVDLYLARGRVVPAALGDNVYSVQVPSAQLPAKVVAYDDRHRAVDVELINTASRTTLAPCPPARFAFAGLAVPSKPYERIDLATDRVGGQLILGSSMAQVVRALGRPDAVRGSLLLYGATSPEDAALTVSIGRRHRVASLQYQHQGVVDLRLGHLLRLQPTELQRRIAVTYGSRYQLSYAYGSEPSLVGCTGVFRTRSEAVELSFGIDPSRSSRTFLRLRKEGL